MRPPATRSRKPSNNESLVDAVNQIQGDHPNARVETWAQDEARMSLKPIFRRVWVPREYHRVGDHKPRSQWLYLYALVRPATGDVFWLVTRP